MRSNSVSVPWGASLTQAEHQLLLYFLVVAALAFLAGLIRTAVTRNEVGSRYRSAVTARLAMLTAAFVSYLLIVVVFLTSYDHDGALWTPNDNAVNIFAVRYMEWSVSVPLLCMELLAVCAVVGRLHRRDQAVAVAAAFAMIFSGFLGAIVIDDGTNTTAFIICACIGALFWVIASLVLVRAVRRSLSTLTPESHTLLKRASITLLAGWFIYPLVYFIPLLGAGGTFTTVIVITLTVADVIVKLRFSTQIHRVAKLRTAEDVRAGDDVHPESIWISSVKQSDAGLPREVHLADGAVIHPPRRQPPIGTAFASEAPDEEDY